VRYSDDENESNSEGDNTDVSEDEDSEDEDEVPVSEDEDSEDEDQVDVSEDEDSEDEEAHVDEEALLPLSGPSFLDFIRYNVCVMPGGPGRYTLTVQDSKAFCSEKSLCKYGLQKEKNRAVAQGFKRTLKSVEGQTKTLQNKLWDAYEGLDNNRHVRSFGNVNFTADTKDLVMALIPTSHQL